jgi:predicted RNA-binding Zn-ribbon protein involved in translation (DUF1610 family)
MEHLEALPIDKEIIEALAPKLDVGLGNENFLELPELNVAFEGISNKIIVLLDRYTSGYECPKCKGMQKVTRTTRCKCDPVDFDPEKHLEPGTKNRHGALCEDCNGDFMSKRTSTVIDCPMCKGKGGNIIIPDSAKSLPTTGVVLSKGPDVTRIRLHRRIIATPYSGTFLPMKGNARIKVYTENEPLCYLHNMTKEGVVIENMVNMEANTITDLDVTNFVEIDIPLPDGTNA